MSSIPYNQSILVESDRATASVKHNTNNSSWTNTLGTTINLEPGDKVSLYSSYLNVRGAESTNSVEFLGEKLSTNPEFAVKSFNHITFDEGEEFITDAADTEIFNIQPTFQNATTTTTTKELKDTEANLVIGYYKNMDLKNYIQLPRRFIPNTETSIDAQWRDDDLSAVQSAAGLGRDTGRVNRETATINADFNETYGYVPGDYDPIHHYETKGTGVLGNLKRLILKNDNSRYTIFVRKNTWRHLKRLPTGQISPPPNTGIDLHKYSPPYFARDPEFFDYLPYKELIDLKVDKGFSSAQFIGEDITRQLQTSNTERSEQFQRGQNSFTNIDFQVIFNEIINAKTYKPFRATNDIYNAENNYDKSIKNSGVAPANGFNGATTLDRTANGVKFDYEVSAASNSLSQLYYETYQYIGLKRPEIYESGCAINSLFGVPLFQTITDQAESRTTPLILGDAYANPVISNTLYTQENLLKWKAFIDSQALYPELFTLKTLFRMYDYFLVGNPYVYQVGKELKSDLNIDNVRFLHMNTNGFETMNDKLHDDITKDGLPGVWRDAKLGSSYYDWRGTKDSGGTIVFNKTLDEDVKSQPFFFHYDPTQKDTFYDNPSEGQYTYGCFGQSNTGRIVIYPNKVINNGVNVGLPTPFFSNEPSLEAGRKLGFDRHWNSWGTAAIGLSSGIPSRSRIPTGGNVESDPGIIDVDINVPLKDSGTAVASSFRTNLYNNFCYLGADNPKVEFDGNHFFIDNLHTPLNEGDLGEQKAAQPSASRDVYKMNPIQSYVNYTPTQFPYEQEIVFHYPNEPSSTQNTWLRPNRNIHKFAIFDGGTGIFFEDMGFNENVWDESLWGRLGFIYSQFNSASGSSSDRNRRYSSSFELSSDKATTNGQVLARDTKGWSQNKYRNPYYDGSIAHPLRLHLNENVGGTNVRVQFYPEVVIPTESIKILAENYPLSLQKGYYAIRTDIIPTSDFAGGNSGNTNLPIIGIVDKQNPVNDFFVGTENTIQFMITKKIAFSSVSITITDPDGTFANLGENSSVVFRIDKNRILETNIAEQIREQILADQQSKLKSY